MNTTFITSVLLIPTPYINGKKYILVKIFQNPEVMHAAVSIRIGKQTYKLNRLYVYGGIEIREGQCGTMHCIELNEEKKKWKKCELSGCFPEKFSNAAGTLIGNEWYIIGGLIDNEQSANIYVVDLDTLEGKLIHNVSCIPIDSHTANAIDDENILIFGGYIGVQKSNKIYQYSMHSKSFTELSVYGSKPLPRTCHSTVLLNNTLIVFGGIDESGGKLSDLWKFDLQLKQWFEVSSNEGFWPKARSGHSACVYDGKMYVFGGNFGQIQETNEMIYWDPKTEEWDLVHCNQKVQSEQDRSSPITALKVKKIKDEAKRRMKEGFSGEIHSLLRLTACKVSTNEKPRAKRKNCTKSVAGRCKRSGMIINDINNVTIKRDGSSSPIEKIMRNSVVMNAKLSSIETINEIRMVNKYPCERDGHVAEVHNGKLYVFGGDRCKMGYNDFFVFPL